MNRNQTKAQVLILDDDRLFCDAVKLYFQAEPFDMTLAHTVRDAQRLCREYEYDVVLLDYNLPDGNGLELIPHIFQANEEAKIILVTAYPSLDNAVAALKTGAYDYLSKPIELEEFRVTLLRAIRAAQLEQVEQVQQYRDDRESGESVLLGEAPAFLEIRELIRKAATTSASVLITGETGTGKTMVAKAIHFGKPGKPGPFLSVNCAAFPESLIEAELFGVEKGAFTGAVTTRKGIFEIAEGGTLFLDEIGEMPIALQSKLLSVIEDRRVKRVGGSLVRTVNVRIMAATNLEPERGIAEGRWRSDLYYRLSVIRVHLPPLRERVQDIPYFCDFFIRKLAPGRKVQVPEDEMNILCAYHWQGNIRELKNVIERSLILQDGPWLRPSHLLAVPGLSRPVASEPPPPPPPEPPPELAPESETLSLAEVERRHILHTLKRNAGNYARTAQALGISFSTLKRKLTDYGVRLPVQNEQTKQID